MIIIKRCALVVGRGIAVIIDYLDDASETVNIDDVILLEDGGRSSGSQIGQSITDHLKLLLLLTVAVAAATDDEVTKEGIQVAARSVANACRLRAGNDKVLLAITANGG